MTVTWLTRLDDLIDLITDPTPTAPIRASAVLRQLLNDGGSSLYLAAQRETGARVLFNVPHNPDDRVPVWFVQPDAPSGGTTREVRAEAFLRFRVTAAPDGSTGHVSVRELVAFAAHVAGGVHSGAQTPDDAKTQATLAACSAVARGDFLQIALRVVGRIAAIGLQRSRELALGLGRFDGAAGFAVSLRLCTLATDVRDDTTILTLASGDDPIVSLRLREERLRVFVAGSVPPLMLRGARPRDDWMAKVDLEIGRVGPELMIRASVDGLESVAVVRAGDVSPHSWESWWTDSRLVLSLGFSKVGAFAVDAWSVSSPTLSAQQRLHLRALLDYHTARGLGANAPVFTPGRGMVWDAARAALVAPRPDARPFTWKAVADQYRR